MVRGNHKFLAGRTSRQTLLQESDMSHTSRGPCRQLRMRAVHSSDAIALVIVEIIIVTMSSLVPVRLGHRIDWRGVNRNVTGSRAGPGRRCWCETVSREEV